MRRGDDMRGKKVLVCLKTVAGVEGDTNARMLPVQEKKGFRLT